VDIRITLHLSILDTCTDTRPDAYMILFRTFPVIAAKVPI